MNTTKEFDEKAILDGLLKSAKANKDRSIRVYIDADANPWFLLNDVIRVLDLDIQKVEEAAALMNGNDKKRLNFKGCPKLPGIGVSTLALYYVVFHANSPYVVDFARWIQHEILPLIEKSGRGVFTTPQFDELAALIWNLKARLEELEKQGKETNELRYVSVN